MQHRTNHENCCGPVPSAQGERGHVLIMALFLSLIVGFAIAAATSTAFRRAKSSRYMLDQTNSLALAEGVTESAQKRMLDDVANFLQPTLNGTVTINSIEYPFTATAAGPPINRTDVDGILLAIQPYEINATVNTGDGFSRVTRIVDLTMTPIFQYMIFYSTDCEILPGPNMTLGGRVHANGDIYVGCGNTLSVDTDYFRCTGEILRERKNNGSTTGGNVSIKVFEDSSYVNMTTSMDSDNADWTDMALTTWGGTVQSGAHGVSEVSVPNIGSIKAFDSDGNPGYYHQNAGLVIRDGVAYDNGGSALTLPPGTLTETTIYDAREGMNVTVTEVDVDLLNSSGYFPANGLVYAYRTDSTSAQPNGIRLSNGAELGGPLTVVTEAPLYVQGDFNTVNKKPAAVMSDAVNLLSNAWNDTKAPGSGVPGASNTTYNLAMVTGDIPTPDGGGSYSGGFENLPRFHENWSGRTCSIRGSFIKIFESEIARAPWGSSGVYSPPGRDWLFDPDLLDPNNMPPFTPQAVYFRRVVWDDNVPQPF